jgi:hypothetical protein
MKGPKPLEKGKREENGLETYGKAAKEDAEKLSNALNAAMMALISAGFFLLINKGEEKTVPVTPKPAIEDTSKAEQKVDHTLIIKKLDYISKYFSLTETQLDILKSNPKVQIVCEFSDFLMRVEENKRQLADVWQYISVNFESLPDTLKQDIEKLLDQASAMKPVTKESVTQDLSRPAQTGTICGLTFSIGFKFISSGTIQNFQELSKKIVSQLATHLQNKLVNGTDKEKVSAFQTAEKFSSLIFKKIGEMQ